MRTCVTSRGPFPRIAVLRAVRTAAAAVLLGLLATGCSPTGPAPARSGGMPTEIGVSELRQQMKGGKPPVLVDVREAEEHAASSLPNSLNIPLGELPDRLGSLDKNADIVVFCRSGKRSGKAVELLRQKGFAKARSLAGGMQEWSRQ
jgi:sulfur-carrier protein adenylyltransferase/sulfurtransferase